MVWEFFYDQGMLFYISERVCEAGLLSGFIQLGQARNHNLLCVKASYLKVSWNLKVTNLDFKILLKCYQGACPISEHSFGMKYVWFLNTF